MVLIAKIFLPFWHNKLIHVKIKLKNALFSSSILVILFGLCILNEKDQAPDKDKIVSNTAIHSWGENASVNASQFIFIGGGLI